MRLSRLGFTLMELMIVVSIILLLVAMTIPVIGLIRKQAKEAVCRNNLTQIGIGITAFQQDNNNHFPVTLGTLFETSQPLASESPRVMLCPFDAKKGADQYMGRPANWGVLSELYQSSTPGAPKSSYVFEAADAPMGSEVDSSWKFKSGKEWRKDGRVTWADAKVFQLKKGNTGDKPYRMSDIPILRCFWHSAWPDNYDAANEKRVLNLAWDMSLFWSIPKWEDQVSAP